MWLKIDHVVQYCSGYNARQCTHSAIIIKYTRYSIMKKKLRITQHSPAYWRVTFDNPSLNLIDPDILHELQDLINQFVIPSSLALDSHS